MIGPRGQMVYNKNTRKFVWYKNRVVEVMDKKDVEDAGSVDILTFNVEKKEEVLE
jgi:hypothetical protein